MTSESDSRATGTSATGTSFWQTVLAMVLAPVVWTIAAFVVGFIIALTQRLFTVIRPEIIDFFAAIMAGIAGVIAARAACDKLFENYVRKCIFILFTLLILLFSAVEIFMVPAHWGMITVFAQFIAVIITAYMVFWNEVDPFN